MNFPMQYPIFKFFYWLVNTPGLGGIFVTILGGSIVLTYSLVLQWIRRGGQAKEKRTYAYPTSALHYRKDE